MGIEFGKRGRSVEQPAEKKWEHFDISMLPAFERLHDPEMIELLETRNTILAQPDHVGDDTRQLARIEANILSRWKAIQGSH